MKKSAVFAFVGLLLLSFISNGQASEIFSTSDGAIKGYDVVAYFTESRPVKGKKEFTTGHAGETWHFVSAENLKTFKASPEKYTPQFGGYCAYGMSRGYKAKIDPKAWTIVDGKLYLNYNLEVRKIWNEKQGEEINKANTNWPTVKSSTFE